MYTPFSTSDVAAAQNEGSMGWDAVWREDCHYGQNFQGELHWLFMMFLEKALWEIHSTVFCLIRCSVRFCFSFEINYNPRPSQWLSGKESTCSAGDVGSIPGSGRRRPWQPTPGFLPGESHGESSLAGYSPWGWKRRDTTEATLHT